MQKLSPNDNNHYMAAHIENMRTLSEIRKAATRAKIGCVVLSVLAIAIIAIRFWPA